MIEGWPISDGIVSTRVRPDLAEVTGQWRWGAFFSRAGRSLDSVLQAERDAAASRASLPWTLVLAAGGEPAGMASLAARDPDEWPDLGPWLAGVYVPEDVRRRGYATRLVAAVEDVARREGFGTLWLYTRSAAPLYRRCGWRDVDTFPSGGETHMLMRRDLGP